MNRFRAWLRAILPKGLYARALMILLLPMLLMQLFGTFMFYTRHWDTVSRHMAMALANEVAYVAERSEQAETRHYSLMLARQFFSLQASWGPEIPHEPTITEKRFAELERQLATRLTVPFSIRSFGVDEDILILIHQPQGTLRILANGKRVASVTTYIFVLWLNGAAIVLLLISLLFLRNQIRPIERLAQAAEAFGRGQEMDHYKPRGALEVRRAGQAFLLMRERIRRQLVKRTQMLASISHDLRTPLTRMKLQLALMGDDASVQDLNRDIAEMEAMIKEYLDFVRGEGMEQPSPLSIRAFLLDLAADYRRENRALMLECPNDTTLMLREQAMRRALCNLINNALRHGTSVRLSAIVANNHLRLLVEDDGPGMDEADYPKAMEAFHRLDEARTPASADSHPTANVGLGLSIARDIVLSHGGMLRLGKSDMGGLRVEITLPL